MQQEKNVLNSTQKEKSLNITNQNNTQTQQESMKFKEIQNTDRNSNPGDKSLPQIKHNSTSNSNASRIYGNRRYNKTGSSYHSLNQEQLNNHQINSNNNLYTPQSGKLDLKLERFLIYKERKSIDTVSKQSLEIRDLDKRISQCRRALLMQKQHQEKIKQNELIKAQFDQTDILIQKEQERQQRLLEEYNEQNNFDFLTGVGIQEDQQKQEEEEQQQQENISQKAISQDEIQVENVDHYEQHLYITDRQQKTLKNQYNQIRDAVDVKKAFLKSQHQYQNDICKAFVHREKFPKKQRKQKVPKLYLTTKTHGIEKGDQCLDELEHKMRVVNKEHKVCKCEVLVPTFTSKKDNVSGTVVAYMKDYKPLLQGYKEYLPKVVKTMLDDELQGLQEQAQQQQSQQKSSVYNQNSTQRNSQQFVSQYSFN